MLDRNSFFLFIPQNSDNKPWAYVYSKGFLPGLIFAGSYFLTTYYSREFVSKWVGLKVAWGDNKNSLLSLSTGL